LQSLKILAKECTFKAVNASQYKDEYIRDAFINGIMSNNIHQRLLENDELSLEKAVTLSRALEMAQKQSEAYSTPVESINYVSADKIETEDEQSVIAVIRQKCFFCGHDRHPRNSCPAREAVCRNCDKKGHFAKVCILKKTQNLYKSNTTTSAFIANLACISANLPGALLKNHY